MKKTTASVTNPSDRLPKEQAGLKDSVRVKILQSALVVLRRDGFSAFTQSGVAQEAGVRQSHITYYFPTRSALLQAVAGHLKELAVPTSSVLTGGVSLKTLHTLLCADLENSAVARMMLALTVAADEDNSLRVWLTAFEVDNKAKFKQAIAWKGKDVDLDVFHATVMGATLLHLQQQTPQSIRQARRTIKAAIETLATAAGI